MFLRNQLFLAAILTGTLAVVDGATLGLPGIGIGALAGLGAGG
jgi:hypothetical protein